MHFKHKTAAVNEGEEEVLEEEEPAPAIKNEMNKPQRVADESITGNNNNNNKTDSTTDAIAIAPTHKHTHTHTKADTHNSVHPTKQPC